MFASAQTLQFNQRQTQTLSPRLQHAVRLLQMSSLEFAQTLADSLGRNPFLESAEGEDEGLTAPLTALSTVAEPGLNDAPDAVPLGSLPRESLDGHDAAGAEGERDLHDSDSLSDERDAGGDEMLEAPGWADGVPGQPRGEGGDFSAMDLVASASTLSGHLHAQLNLLPLEPRDMALAKVVVESLDDDGYLRADPLELLATAELQPAASSEEMQIALRRVQSLDPAGVAARSVQECLLLQIGQVACPVRRALVERILQDHLKLLAARDGAGLARKLCCSLADAEAACHEIRRFDPRPGSRFGAPQIQYVTPDVVARRQGRQWVAVLNPAVVPRLRLNQGIVDLYRRHRGAACPGMASHLQEARWTLRNVEQRFSTIVSVAQAILDRQHHFLEYGEMAMKPLGLREIANEVGVHESTVSRVTSNKFIATPGGVFELKRFFSRAMVMASGNACSGTAIRGLVRDIIEGEQREKPLSDADITELLGQQGLTVARRTVTKYRQALRIEPVARRRAAGAMGAVA